MKTDRISFTSKINFIDEKTFDKLYRKGQYIDAKLRDRALGFDEFYTDEVRTCTAGAIIDYTNKKAVGFHFFDDLDDNLNINKFLNKLFRSVQTPESALIIGGKELKFSNYSMPNFNKICEVITNKVPNVTIFGNHRFPWSESNFHYSIENDTWTISSIFRPLTDYKIFDVESVKDLHTAFKQIKLSPNDRLYINGNNVEL